MGGGNSDQDTSVKEVSKKFNEPRVKNAASSDTDNERKMLVRDRWECSVLSSVLF